MLQKKKFAVILSGCGVYDGSEIHEAVLTLLAIDKSGNQYQCFAPNIDQYHVINHLTGDETNEKRNVLKESARIARGNIKPLSEFNASDYDFLILPGGFGAAKNLSDLAFKGENCEINSNVQDSVTAMLKQNKAIGALCIAPVIIAKIIAGAKVTIGSNESTIKIITAMGGIHEIKTHGEVTIDTKHKIVTTPCYMLDTSISEVAIGAEAVVNSMLKL